MTSVIGVLRMIFGRNVEKMIKFWRKVHND